MPVDETLIQPPEGTTLSWDMHPAGDIPHPSEAVEPVPAQPAPAEMPNSGSQMPNMGSQTQSRGASVTYKGITDDTLKKTAKIQTRADRLAAQDSAPQNAMYEEATVFAQDNARDQAMIARERAAKEKEHFAKEMEFAEAMRTINDTAAKAHAEAWDSSKVVQQQYIGQLEQQLAGVRQLSQSSGDPYETMGRGVALGLIAQHAVQGFLAPAGVNIDVAGMTDRWINREMQKHQNKIQNAREDAQGTMHLYQIARQSSQDDYEARERYRAFLLEGMKNQVTAEAARFNSELANTNAKQRVAEIDAQLNQVKLSLGERKFQGEYNNRKLRIDQAHMQASDAAAMINAKANMMEAETRRKAEDKKVPAGALDGMFAVYDPFEERGPGSKPKWYINPDDKDGMSKFREKEVATRALYSQLTELQRLKARAEKASGGPLPLATDFMKGKLSQEYREYLQARTSVVATITKSYSGAAFTDSERKTYLSMLPSEKFWEAGKNDAAIPILKNKLRTDFQGAADTYDWSRAGAKAGENVEAEYNILTGERGGPVSTVAGGLLKEAKDEGSDEILEPSRTFQELMPVVSHPGSRQVHDKTGQPEKLKVVEDLARIALDPRGSRQQFARPGATMPDSDEMFRHEAVAALDRLTEDSDPFISAYASKLVETMKSDPQRLKGLMGIRNSIVETSDWISPTEAASTPLSPVK